MLSVVHCGGREHVGFEFRSAGRKDHCAEVAAFYCHEVERLVQVAEGPIDWQLRRHLLCKPACEVGTGRQRERSIVLQHKEQGVVIIAP